MCCILMRSTDLEFEIMMQPSLGNIQQFECRKLIKPTTAENVNIWDELLSFQQDSNPGTSRCQQYENYITTESSTLRWTLKNDG